MKQVTQGGVRGLALAVCWLTGALTAGGTTVTWDGSDSTGWSTNANWAGGVAPVVGDDILFTSGNPLNQPVNNDLAGLSSVNSLQFLNNTFTAPLTLAGGGFALVGGLTNLNTTGGREVTISNALTINTPQFWVTALNTAAVTVIAGDLTGSGTISNCNNQVNGGARPTIRLGGNNAGFTGLIRTSIANGGSLNGGLLLLGPQAMIAGQIDQTQQQDALYLHGGTGVGTYTFGIGTVPQGGLGTVNFKNSGSGGLWLAGGDVTWDPGNGGGYTWTNGATYNYITLGGRTLDALNAVLYVGNAASQFILGGGSKFIRSGAPNNGQITVLRSALADDGTARAFDTSANLLVLTQAAAGNLGGATTVSGGALAVTNMDRIFNGNLNLSGGVLLLDDLTWSDFTTDRGGGNGTGANQWRVTGGGFAVRGAALTISGGGVSEFDSGFVLGSAARWTNNTLYADAAVTVAQAVTMTANRTITALGGNQESTTRWTVNSPVHEVSGLIAESGGARILNLAGSDRQNPRNGTVRISNAGNSFTGGVRVNSTSSSGAGGGGGVIAIFTDDGCFGSGSVYVGSGGSGAAGLLLFENQGVGTKDFSKSFEVALGTDTSSGDSGFGSWAGNVRYNGTVTITGDRTSLPVHVQAGQFSFGPGSVIANNSSGAAQTYNKAGAGELVLDGNTTYDGSNPNLAWTLREGTLTTVVDGKLVNGAATFSGGNLLSTNFNSTSPARTWNVVSNDQSYTSSSMTYGGDATVTVAAGLTLTLHTGASNTSPSEGTGNGTSTPRWNLVKNGGGTWILSNTDLTPLAAYGPQNGAGFIRIDEGTLDITGDYARGSLSVNGGTLLSGAVSPFTYSTSAGTFTLGVSQVNLLEVTAAGGKIGLSAAAAGHVTRTVSFGWDQTAPHSLTLAARDNLNLVFSAASLPDVAGSTTLLIARDGTGSGLVQWNDTTWTVNGTLGGTGTLKLGSSGTGTATVNGTLQPGGTNVAALGVQGHVVLAAAATNAFQLGAIGSSDQLAVTGDLTVNGALNVTQAAGFGAGTYVLMTCSGTLTSNALAVGSAPSGYEYQVTMVSGEVRLTVSRPELGVRGNGVDIANADSTPAVADDTDFGSVSADGAGGAFAQHPFTITNELNGLLVLDGSPSVSLSGTGASDFLVTVQPTATNVAGYESVTFTVRFDPAAVGLSTATVSIANNDLDEDPFTFTVQGQGVGGGPEIAVLGTNLAEIADGDAVPSAADGTDFGSLAAGYVDRTFTITNSGSANLTLDGSPVVAVGGANTGDFAVTVLPAATVLPGETTEFTVRFLPAAPGLREATLSLASDDASEDPYDFAVQGTFTGPELAILGTNGAVIASGDGTPSAADGSDFGSVAVYAATQTHTFAVTNSGNGALLLDGVPSVQLAGAHAADFTVTVQPASTNVPIGDRVAFTLEFNPSAAGVRSATLTLPNTDPDENPYTFALAGTGLLPAMGVLGTDGSALADGDGSPATADGTDYGAVESGGGTLAHTFTITNTGPAALVLTGATAVVLGGADPADFAVTMQPGVTTLVAGATTTFTVQFAPAGNGLREATVSIGNCDPVRDPYDFALQGSGVPAARTWDGSASATWSDPANWLEGQAPANGNSLAFTQDNPPNQPLNNDLVGLIAVALVFSNNSFTAPLTLGGNAISLEGGLTNLNTTAGRDVTIGTDVAVTAPQVWATPNDADAVTVLSGNLSGTGTVTISDNQSNGGLKPTIRLTGTNAAFTGRVTYSSAFSGSIQGGVLLAGPQAMIGGLIDMSTTQMGLYLQGGAGVGTYTFGLGTVPQGGLGTASFLNSGSGGLWLWGGDVAWDPGNGGHYTWTNGAAYNYITLGGRASDAANAVLYVGNASSRFILGGGNKTIRSGAANNGQITVLRSALADDGTARAFDTGCELLVLTQAAAGNLGGTTTVSGGALAIDSMDRIFDGNLTLSGGMLVLNNIAWSAFATDRGSGYGAGADQWRITTGDGGFAARTAAVTVSGGDATQFDRDFALGSAARWTNGTLYADAAVTIAQAITLTANRAVKVRGGNQESLTRWTVNSPVHEISGAIGESGGARILNLVGADRQNPYNGTIRISNAGNSFTGGVRVNSTSLGGAGGGGGVIAIFTDDGCFGSGSVYVGSGGSGAAGLLLFENQGAGTKDFSKSFEVALGSDPSSGDSGFGAWAGNARYNGTVTVSGSKSTLPVLVQAGSLAFGAGSALVNNSSGGTQSYNKAGAGELVLDANVAYGGSDLDVQWVLREGTLTTVVDGKLVSGAATFNGGNLLSVGFSSTSPARTWNVVSNDQSYTSSSMTYGGDATVTVAAGLTLTLHTGASNTSPSEGTGNGTSTPRWNLVKNGGGTWILSNTDLTPLAAYGPQNGAGFIRIDEGTLDITGDYARGSLSVNGGTLLSGAVSPFTYSTSAGTFTLGVSQVNLLEVTAAGGKIGLSAAAAGHVTRTVSFGWDQTAPHSLTLAARDDLNLVFSAASLPDVAGSTTLLIARDGTGSGLVQWNDTTWTVNGTLGGTGTLKVGAAGTGTVTVNGAVAPGGAAVGALTVQGHVVCGSGTVYDLQLGGLGTGDVLAVNGNLTLDGTVNVSNAGGLTVGSYVIATYTGAFTDNGLTVGSMPPGFNARVVTAVAGQVRLTIRAQTVILFR